MRKETRKLEWEREVSQADRWINTQIKVDNLKRKIIARDDRDKDNSESEQAREKER